MICNQSPWPLRLSAFYAAICLSIAASAQTLSVSPSPAALTIYPGQQNIPVTVSVTGTQAGQPVTVTFIGLPSGVTATPATLTADGDATIQLNASRAAGQEGFPTQASQVVEWTAAPTIVAVSGAARATAAFALTISISNPSFVPATINLPIVNINTSGVPITSGTTDVSGTITITSADGQTSYLPNSGDTDDTASFHVHGHTTAAMPKVPYHVKLNTSLDLLATMGLACPYVTSKGSAVCDKSKSYILLANYDDKTFLRDWAASALANAIPIGNGYLDSPAGSPSPSGTSALMPWAPHSLFVELYINGAYQGDYQLIEQVKADSHRLNITELTESDTTDDITGGYLLEIDHHEDEAFVFTTPVGLPIGLIDPDFTPDPEVPQQTAYISNYVDTAETALFSSNFTDPTLGWRAYFDEASAVNFYIVNDLMGNVDGGDFYSSDYLYKAIDNPLLYMGPIWDFDISSGNVNYAAITDPTVPWGQTQSAWYTQWFKDPGFRADVVTQWNALKNNGVFSTWIASIPTQAATLEQSQANNFGRWPMQGIKVWPNPEAAGSYDGEVQYLTTWLQLRMAYLDSVFNNKAATTTTLTAGSDTFRSGVAATLTAQVTGGSSPTGVVTFLSGGVVLGGAALGSGGTATLSTAALPVGTDSLRAVYNGDATNALSASSTVSVTVASPLSATTVNVIGPASVDLGGSATFAASVIADQGTPPPTGSVTFTLDDGTTASATLGANQTATASLTPATAGTRVLTASYSGDAGYAASTGTISISVIGPPGFSVSDTNVSLGAGATTGNTSTITVTPTGGFTGSVALTATLTSSPAGASKVPTFSFGTTAPVTVSAGPATATLTIATTAPTTTTSSVRPLLGAGGLTFAGLFLLGLRRQRRRFSTFLGALLLAAALATAAIGCGNGKSNGGSGGGSGSGSGGGTTTTVPGTTPGLYIITITATSGSLTSQSTINLQVQ